MTDMSKELLDPRLVESEARYEAVIENASDMIQSVRPDGTFEFVNKSWKDKLGYTDEDLQSMIIWDVIHETSMEHCMITFTQILGGEDVGEMQIVFKCKDGDPLTVVGTATNRIIDDEIVATHGFFRDISEQLRAQQLELENAKLEADNKVRYLEKMAALGKLSAGLSHELNNPAAAAQRASVGLQEALSRRDDAQNSLVSQGLTPQQCQEINAMRQQMVDADSIQPELSPMAVSAREELLERWLEDHDVPEPWNLAPMLARTKFSGEDLDQVARALPPELTPAAMNWIAESVAVRDHTNVIGRSAHRISELVSAVKAYSYMDQATEQMVDVHEGLDNTLIILAHPLQNMTVVRDFCESLPLIPAQGSGLNQVWTNLLDNAADATGGCGTIQIHTSQEDDNVVVQIEDDGPGIPEAIQSRIFEPFFTTKPQGEGTGLGLEIVWRIIVEEHGGSIDIDSEPGKTIFTITLPIHSATQQLD